MLSVGWVIAGGPVSGTPSQRVRGGPQHKLRLHQRQRPAPEHRQVGVGAVAEQVGSPQGAVDGQQRPKGGLGFGF